MSNRKYILLAWVILPLLLLPTVSLAGTTTGSATSVKATNPDLAAVARKVPLRGPFRLTDLELDGIPGGNDLELERFRVFTPDARIVLDGSKTLPIPDNRYFKGRIAGEPGSRVLLTLRQSGELRGLIVRDGELWMLAGGAGTGIVAPGLVSRRAEPDLELADQTAGFRCEIDRLPPRESSSKHLSTPPPTIITEQVTPPTYVARVAIETDTEYFSHFGGAPAAEDYAGDLIAYSSTIFESEVDTSLEISSISLWSSSDPWTETGCDRNRLEELEDYWLIAHPTEERTLVHMLSGKSTLCGIAWVGGLCDKNDGYSVSSGLTFSFDPGIGWDIMVVSHEIGHNFNSPHTHCYAGLGDNEQQVDECSNADCGWNPISYDCYCGNTTQLPPPCSGESGCGTLMSYCNQLSPGLSNISLTFGLGHPYGNAPYRVPFRMRDHVVRRAASYPGCFNPLLTITKQGNGSGTVTSNPAGIDCGEGCTVDYPHGTAVSLTAVPDLDSLVGGWSGDDDCSDGELEMSSDLSCTMTFDLCPILPLVDLLDMEISNEQEFAACNILTATAFRVLDGGDVTFRAGNRIILKDGFVVESGAAFRAIIGPPPS